MPRSVSFLSCASRATCSVRPPFPGSIQYASVHLGTPLLVVLGHDACGAVEAGDRGEVPWRDPREPRRLSSSRRSSRRSTGSIRRSRREALCRSAVEANVRRTVGEILATPEAQAQLGSSHLRLVGAVYDIVVGARPVSRTLMPCPGRGQCVAEVWI